MMHNFLPLVFDGSVTGFNSMNKVMVFDGHKIVSYGHDNLKHLHLILNELKEKGLLVKHLIGRRDSIYLWDDNWEAGVNTKIITAGSKSIAVETGYMLNFFPKNGTADSLIDFLTSRCMKNGDDCIKDSWEVPFITATAYHRKLVPTKEVTFNCNGKIEMSFVPDKFKAGPEGKERVVYLVQPLADFVKS